MRTLLAEISIYWSSCACLRVLSTLRRLIRELHSKTFLSRERVTIWDCPIIADFAIIRDNPSIQSSLLLRATRRRPRHDSTRLLALPNLYLTHNERTNRGLLKQRSPISRRTDTDKYLYFQVITHIHSHSEVMMYRWEHTGNYFWVKLRNFR